VALNRALLREQLDGRFCTVALAFVEPDLGGGARLSIASGGHPLPQHVTADGTTRRVGRHGTLLGVAEKVRIEDVDVSLAPGDAVVLFTDGILTKGEASGDESTGLLAALRDGPHTSAAELRDRIEGYVQELIAEEQSDDVAVLVVRVR
jgi:serine phosphatase RsbU (regulator of sigma subunit)